MSYFACVRPADGKQFRVHRCHINLWSLPGVGRRVQFFDVGLHLQAEEDGFNEFDIALPFSAATITDVSTSLRDTVTSQLIFRHESNGNKVKLSSDTDVEISEVLDEQCCKAKGDRKDRNLWHVRIPELKNGENRYYRIRFSVRNCARMWTSKRHGLLNFGALLDLRISDTREAPGDRYWDAVRNRIVAIDDLNAFVIMPLSLQLQNASPQLYTSRILEGDSWETYLGRRTRGERLVIYQWNMNFPAHREFIGPSKPYRIFLDLSKEVISVSIPATFQSAVAALLIAFGMVGSVWWAFTLFDFVELSTNWISYLIGLGATGVISFLVKQLGWMKWIGSRASEFVAQLDRWRFVKN